jgi:hypothetical protein
MKLSVIATFVCFFLGTAVLIPQEPPSMRNDSQPVAAQGGGNDRWQRDQLHKMEREQKALRQKQLKEDTEKLLQLATELKTSVDKTNEHVLSLDVVKKAEEIEKLAKHIKTNMRDEMR